MGTGAGEVEFQAGGGGLPLFMRLSARVFGGMLLALYAAVSFAQTANVESVPPLSGGAVWYNNWGMGPYASPAAACKAYNCPICGSLTYIGTIPNCCGYAALGYRDCQFTYQPTGQTILSGTVLPFSNAVCPTPAINPAVPYTFNPLTSLCERPVQQSCPAHSSGTYPSNCICDTGYKVDPVTQASCISACPVKDLPPITDPQVQSFENNPKLTDTADLTPRMQTALSCLLKDAAADSPSVGSAYRPPAYNQHLIDVWEKWMYELKKNKNPACASLKTKIKEHFQKHGLLETQPPVPGSLHTKGEAVDVTINLPAANIDALATGCKLRRSVPVKDPVHFVHQ